MRQYIGARYVPKFMGTYDPTQAYEALCVVDNGMGTSYISTVPTPANTPLTNTDYWAIYGASSGAIINLQNQIDQINNVDLPAITSDINTLENTTIPAITSDINTLNNTTIPAIENDIDNIEASIVDVTKGPEQLTGSEDISDHAIHTLTSVTLPARGRYIMIFKTDFEFPAAETGVVHSLEMEISTIANPAYFGKGRATYIGREFTTNGAGVVASLVLPYQLTPTSDTTFYLHVRDMSTGSSVNVYPYITSTNFA